METTTMAMQIGLAEASQNFWNWVLTGVKHAAAAPKVRQDTPEKTGAFPPDGNPRLLNLSSPEANQALNQLLVAMSSIAIRMDGFGNIR